MPQVSRRKIVIDSGDEFEFVPIDGCKHLYEALVLFNYCEFATDGFVPLSASDVRAWCEGLEIKLLPIEFKMIIDLSSVYIKYFRMYDEDIYALNPYDPFATDDDEDEENP